MAGSPAPNFTVRQEHTNVPLNNLVTGYHPSGFIAEQVAPVIPVKNESDYYYKYDKLQAFRLGRSDGKASLRADKARAKQLNFGATLDSYIAEEYALEATVSDRELANADAPLNLVDARIRRTQDLILADYELRVANLVETAANYPAANVVTLSGTSQWNNASFVSQPSNQHSAIKAVVDAGKEAIRKATGGKLPTHIILPRPVEVVLANDPGLVDLVKYNVTNVMSSLVEGDYLGPTLWGMKILRPLGMYTTAVEGETTTLTDIWGKNVLMFYQEPTPSLDTLTLAFTLRQRPWAVKTFRDEFSDSTIYRPSFVQAEKLVISDCGYLIQNAVA